MQTNEDMEAEATYFAFCLLMPEEFVRREVANAKMRGAIDLENGHFIKDMARKFKVSEVVMTLRLGQLYPLL